MPYLTLTLTAQVRISPRPVVFIMTVSAIYSLGHGLCTLTAVPRSTQTCTLRGTVKWVAAYELSNSNKWRWCLWMVAANLSVDSQPKSVGLVWGLAATRRSLCIHQVNQVNSRNDYMSWWQHHKHCCDYYHYYYYYYGHVVRSLVKCGMQNAEN